MTLDPMTKRPKAILGPIRGSVIHDNHFQVR